jgi:hypothetical protein
MFASWLMAATTDQRTELPIALLWAIIVLIAVVLVAAGVIIMISRWVKRRNTAATDAYGDDRASFKVLYERGELTQEEYDKIRARLSQKLRQDLKVTAAPPTAGEPPKETDRLRTAGPESTIGPAEGERPGESDPSIKPA